MSQFICSASVMCANLARLEDDLVALEKGGIDELHFDIMDGTFVPNYTLGFDFIKAAKACTPKVHCNAHLMIERPERYIERFAKAGCDSITIHVETCPHAQRTLQQIRDTGASPGIAINPATSLTKLQYLLPYVDRVLIMTVDPGYSGQKIIESSFERVRILNENIRYNEYTAKIEVDGNINVENAARLARFGAEIFVLGTSSVFLGPDIPLGDALATFRAEVETQKHLV